MKDLFAKCGVKCARCPSYRENLKTDLGRQRCSDGWLPSGWLRRRPRNGTRIGS